MRKILFRCKRKDNGEWVYWDMLGRITTHTGKISRATIKSKYGEHYYYFAHQLWDKLDRSTIGQYTGRIDKNKKRVFEGDIIRLCNGFPGFDVGVILWDDNDQAYLIVREPVERVMLDDFGNYGRPEYYEVIGNIHDNPDWKEARDNGMP